MATPASFASEERRPSGRVVSALDSHAGGPGFEPRWDPANFFLFFVSICRAFNLLILVLTGVHTPCLIFQIRAREKSYCDHAFLK